jgi:hypothetical protein
MSKSFTTLTQTQVQFLEQHLRGTGRELSGAQAEAKFGIMNLRARMSEMRSAGLRIRSTVNTAGRTAYAISARDITGSRAARFSA